MSAYYNEHDPFAAAWLRELIKQGHIADGEVDERSIEDVLPNELTGFTQCHFFAGIGVWSYALRQSGWPDDCPVWTGSCPCQPFSAAGKGDGFADERHLWPAFNHLIAQCKPSVVFGEQVASKAVDDWIDLVQSDLEGVGYAFGSVPFPSAGVGASHIRDRNFWVADSTVWGQSRGVRECRSPGRAAREIGGHCAVGGLGNTNDTRPQGRGGMPERADQCAAGQGIVAGGLADTFGAQEHEEQQRPAADERGRGSNELGRRGVADSGATSGPTNGFWRDADWLFCRDGKWRPVEPGTFPLAHGAAARVGRLRGYGNAINAEAAKAFIQSYLVLGGR